MSGQVSTPSAYAGKPAAALVSASRYTFDELAEVYNQTREDYIVPMPMNARRMEEYVRYYDVDLDSSFVTIDGAGEQTGMDRDGERTGLGMLARRGERAWITRLGIKPNQRGHKIGLRLMEALFDSARAKKVHSVQLEVIEGNEPAHHLFLKLGFTETRRLLVIRRPPMPAQPDPSAAISLLSPDEVRACLDLRPAGASWLDETPSLINMGNLVGLRVTLPAGASGWILCCQTPLQLSHFVLDAPDHAVALALLQALHHTYPLRDTKVENLPVDSPWWTTYQQVGYVESFRRIEMLMHL